MDSGYDLTQLEPVVARVLKIDDITSGGPKQGFLVRFRGRLRQEDSAAAYDQLANLLLPYHLTPLFRWDGDRHAVLLVEKAPTPKETNPLLNLAFFIATLLSVFFVGVLNSGLAELPSDPIQAGWALLKAGGPYTVTLLCILGAHEFGHYLVGRAHGVHLTLPFFIPMPIPGSFGTMGAFINMKEQPKNRRHLLDIGLAGPLAGVVVAILALLIGLALSPVQAIIAAPQNSMNVMEGNSILYLALKFIVKGQLLPAPISFGGLPPALYWLRYFFTGRPFPLGAMDVQLHPVAWAGWVGLLVTSLNLIPAGQLDGGHALYVLIGRVWARRLLPAILVVLVLLGFFWNGWWFWAVLIFFFGRVHAQPLDEITPLDPPRIALAVIGIALFFLVFIPVPLTVF
jgi:membrane-associated protease RseP (regulator of RpoE activity)